MVEEASVVLANPFSAHHPVALPGAARAEADALRRSLGRLAGSVSSAGAVYGRPTLPPQPVPSRARENIAHKCEMAVCEGLGALQRPRRFEVSSHAAAGVLSYVVQVMLSVKQCLLERMAVLLGTRSAQLPIMARFIDDQVRILKMRCVGYTASRDCFQAWRAARGGQLAGRRLAELRESQAQNSRLQLETRALTLKLVETTHERDVEIALRWGHWCLVKWHQFVMSKQMIRATETHLRAVEEQRVCDAFRRSRFCNGVVSQWVERQTMTSLRSVLHSWASASVAQRLAGACEHWRVDAVELRTRCERLRALRAQALQSIAIAQERLRLLCVAALCFYDWQRQCRLVAVHHSAASLTQRAGSALATEITLAALLCVLKVWALASCMSKCSNSQIVMKQLRDACADQLRLVRTTAIAARSRRRAFILSHISFTSWRVLFNLDTAAKESAAKMRQRWLRHDARYQRALLVWDLGRRQASQQVYLHFWADAVQIEARARESEKEFFVAQIHTRRANTSRCDCLLISLERVLASFTSLLCFRGWLDALSASLRDAERMQLLAEALAEQLAASSCIGRDKLHCFFRQREAASLKHACMRNWIRHADTQRRESEYSRRMRETRRLAVASHQAQWEKAHRCYERYTSKVEYFARWWDSCSFLVWKRGGERKLAEATQQVQHLLQSQAKILAQQAADVRRQLGERRALESKLDRMTLAWTRWERLFLKRWWMSIWRSACRLAAREINEHRRRQQVEVARDAQAFVLEEKEKECEDMLCRISTTQDAVLSMARRVVEQERLCTVLQLCLVGWAEVLNARALAAEQRNAQEARQSLALALEENFSRALRALERGHTTQIKRAFLGSWLAAIQVARREADAVGRAEASAVQAFEARQEVVLSRNAWVERASRVCELGWASALRRLCLRGWCAACHIQKRHDTDLEKLAMAEQAEVQAREGHAFERRQMMTAWGQEAAWHLKRICVRGWAIVVTEQNRTKLEEQELARTVGYLQRLYLHAWMGVLVTMRVNARRQVEEQQRTAEAERRSACAIEAELAAVRCRAADDHQRRELEHAAMFGSVLFAWQRAEACSLKRACWASWSLLLREKARSEEADQRGKAEKLAQDAVWDRFLFVLDWERAAHRKRACFKGWAEAACSLRRNELEEQFLENCCHLHEAHEARFERLLKLTEWARSLALQRAVLAVWLDVLNADVQAKCDTHSLDSLHTARYVRALEAWRHGDAKSTKHLAFRLWTASLVAVRCVAGETAKMASVDADWQRTCRALDATRCSLEAAWAQERAASMLKACYNAWLAFMHQRSQELEVERRLRNADIAQQRFAEGQLFASQRCARQLDRMAELWYKDRGLVLQHACLHGWLAVLGAEARAMLEEQRLAEAQQCVELVHTARYDWALHAWERGLTVSLKHVCLRGWVSVVDTARREPAQVQQFSECPLPNHDRAIRALLARGRRSASMLRQIHGVLATTAEECSGVAQHRAVGLAAGEVALRSAALPQNSPAWLEARRARMELEQLERLTRHLRKGVIPSLYYIEAAHGELLAAVEVFGSARGNAPRASLPQLTMLQNTLGGQFLSQGSGQEDSSVLSDSFSAGVLSARGLLPVEIHSREPLPLVNSTFMLGRSARSMSPPGREPVCHYTLQRFPAPGGLAAVASRRSSPSPVSSLSPRGHVAVGGAYEFKPSGPLDGVVSDLRNFVAEHRKRSQRARDSPPHQHRSSGHSGHSGNENFNSRQRQPL